MAEPLPQQPITPEQHEAIEIATGLRHELVDGEVFAMGGGTPAHSKVKTNAVLAFGRRLENGPCQVYDADLRIRIDHDVFYPDLTVHCGPLALHPDDVNAATEPVVVVEVLSPSTEAWDRGGKFTRYRAMPSVQHVVFIDPDRKTVEHYERQSDGRWMLESIAPDQNLTLAAVQVELPVEELFRNLPKAPPPPSGPTKTEARGS